MRSCRRARRCSLHDQLTRKVWRWFARLRRALMPRLRATLLTPFGAAFPGYTPIEFFIVPIGDMLVFAALFGAAIYYRKNAANHKRLMLVTVLNFLPPSIGRLPLAFIPDLGAWWFWGVPAVIAVLFLLVDTWRNERFNRVFAAAIALLVLSGPVRLFIARTEAWTQFAGWILG